MGRGLSRQEGEKEWSHLPERDVNDVHRQFLKPKTPEVATKAFLT